MEWILAAATILGGVAAVLFFVEKWKVRQENSATRQPRDQARIAVETADDRKASVHEEVTIAIVTALPDEFRAVCEALDCGELLPSKVRRGRVFRLARVTSCCGGHHLVAVTLLGSAGIQQAAVRVVSLARDFPNLQYVVMCGIACALPNPQNAETHVRLGDIVVCDSNGVVQHDRGKEHVGRMEPRPLRYPPSAELLEATLRLQALGTRPWEERIEALEARLGPEWVRPPESADELKDSDATGPIDHPVDPARREGRPRLFLGPIASGNTVVADPARRNWVRDTFGARALEMEGSGVAEAARDLSVGYQVVRGTCDYGNQDKDDSWHKYAALIAAAYTAALLSEVPAAGVDAGGAVVEPLGQASAAVLGYDDFEAVGRAKAAELRRHLDVLDFGAASEKADDLEAWLELRTAHLKEDLVKDCYDLLVDVAYQQTKLESRSGSKPDLSKLRRLLSKIEDAG